MPSSKSQLLSIVVPVFNEEEAVAPFLAEVSRVMERIANLECEIIFVDDGSRDGTSRAVRDLHAVNPAVCLVRLSRNFGKEAALTAGLEAARGDAVVPMDVDLQDPPALIAEFVTHWRAGYEVVYGQRVNRAADTGMKSGSAGLFYTLFNRISSLEIEPNVGDFRLMDARAVEATLQLRERNRFMKGIFAWVGFHSRAVPYSRPARTLGTTKFNYWKLWNFAIDGITSFSTVPLRVWTYIGGTVALGALFYTAVIVFQTLLFGRDVPGYASLMVVVLMLGAVQLISLGIIGEYLGRLYMESKERPIYLVQEQLGLRAAAPPLRPLETVADAGE